MGSVPECTAMELSELMQEPIPPQILDVRTEAEWRRSHVAGTVNVPIGQLKRRLPQLDLDPQRPVVAICLSAHRSIPAVRLLDKNGFKEARQLTGGMLAWWRAQLPTER